MTVKKAPINGTTIAYDEYGQGEPLLLIHGAGVSRETWKPQLEPLGNHFRLIVPDVRGHGASGQTEAPYSIRLFAEDMIALLDALGIEAALVCGHSMGGAVAQQMAAHYPARVRALVLAETNYGFEGMPVMKLLMSVSESISRMVGMKRLASMTVQQLARGSSEAKAALETGFAPQIANPANFWNIYRANANFAGRSDLSRIQCPTLILIAEQNRRSHAFGRTMAALIPNAQLKTISRAGHGLNWDNAQAFNTAVSEFFLSRSRGGK